MKNQALFSSSDKSEKLKCRLLQFLFGALRVKVIHWLSLIQSLKHLFTVIFIIIFCDCVSHSLG